MNRRVGSAAGSSPRTGVIGGGAAGLATAILLAREGHSVDLFEKNPCLGGRIGVFEREGFRFDTGPSWYLMPEVFEHFFALVGTSADAELDLRTLDPGYTVFSPPGPADTSSGAPGHTRALTIPHGRSRVLETFENVERGTRDALDDYLDSAEHTKELALAHFLYNPFTSPRSLLHRDILGALPKLVRQLGTSLTDFAEASFHDPVLCQILQYPAIFLGTDPRRAPAIYHLMSTLDLDQGVSYPMGGFHTIIDALIRLAERSGVRLHTGADVTRIDTEAAPGRGRTGRRVTGLRWTDEAGRAHRHSADVVVSAADLHHTETQLLDPVDQSFPERSWTSVTSGPGAVLVFLGIEGELEALPHH